MERPLISIVIPVYNGADYVGEAIDSALAQTYENFEVIVVNDGSKDEGATEKVVLSYGDKVRYFAKENGGVSSALNFGIKNANGEWISWLSHDDLYLPEKLACQMMDVEKLLSEGKDVKKTLFYCSGGSFINAQGEKVEKKYKPIADGFYTGADALKAYYQGPGIGGCSLLMPKSMFENVSYFEEDMRFMQDVFMWQKAFIAGYNLYVHYNSLVRTRIHNQQTSTTGKQYQKIDLERVGEYLVEHLDGIKATDGTDLLKCYMYFCARKNNEKVAKDAYEKLLTEKRMRFSDKLRYFGMMTYGKLRKKMVTVYYRVRFGTKR